MANSSMASPTATLHVDVIERLLDLFVAERRASAAPGSGTGQRLPKTHRAPRCRLQALVRQARAGHCRLTYPLKSSGSLPLTRVHGSEAYNFFAFIADNDIVICEFTVRRITGFFEVDIQDVCLGII